MGMGSADQTDDWALNCDFSEEGGAKLKERVKAKLKEFMGDYSDDFLVEYVIVLLKNGRQKEEAQNELNVFLGDDSESFINWLWDHLAGSVDEYLNPQESHIEQTTEIKSLTGSQSDNKESDKSHLIRHGRKCGDLPNDAFEVPSLISSEVHKIDYEEKKDRKGGSDRRSPSSKFRSHRKRIRSDDQPDEQREAKHDVSCRLLQFAVRDALATSRPSNKRLRSVVSTSNEDSSGPVRPPRIRSVAMVVNPMATVIRAVAEAAEDVKKTKSGNGRSVFDRISHSTDLSEPLDQHVKVREAALEDEECDELSKDQEQIQPQYPHGLNYNGTYDEDMSNFDYGLQLYDMSNCNELGICVTASQASFSGGNRIDNPTSVQHNVASQSHLPKAATRFKSASFSRNTDAGKQPKHRGQSELADVGPQRALQEGKIRMVKAIAQSSKEKTSGTAVRNGHVKAPKALTAASGTFIRPFEDADARTIFVTNVHFGATKDSLSRHFNKFGEVLKVVIVTDPGTGLPTGSAYIEFMSKDAAENALSLDGTSFMSRILKIVKGGTGQQEAAPTMTWSRPARFPRGGPYGRGATGAFRGRPPIRPTGPRRSMQWNRHLAAPTETGARRLTYVRTDKTAAATTT